jgi:hypothetical protein
MSMNTAQLRYFVLFTKIEGTIHVTEGTIHVTHILDDNLTFLRRSKFCLSGGFAVHKLHDLHAS